MFRALGRGVERWINRHFIGFTITGLTLLFLFVYFAPNIFITIPPGHGGALWLRFLGGTVEDFHYGEGMKVIFPWDRIYVYDLRVQQESDRFDVLTNEGLQISVDVTLRFRLNPAALGVITRFAGPEFIKTLVMPSVGATVRQEAAKHSAQEIYSTQRPQIEDAIEAELVKTVDQLIEGRKDDKPEIIVEDLWFRSILLPPQLASSIEAKLAQRQLAEQYVYILEREERERQRKMIEAQGIKAFQDIVSSGISENYLRWKGIDATLKLADSPNAKIVIIGGNQGLPLILNAGDTAPATLRLGQGVPPAASAATATMPSSVSPLPLSTDSFLKAEGLPIEPPSVSPRIAAPPKPAGGPIELAPGVPPRANEQKADEQPKPVAPSR